MTESQPKSHRPLNADEDDSVTYIDADDTQVLRAVPLDPVLSDPGAAGATGTDLDPPRYVDPHTRAVVKLVVKGSDEYGVENEGDTEGAEARESTVVDLREEEGTSKASSIPETDGRMLSDGKDPSEEAFRKSMSSDPTVPVAGNTSPKSQAEPKAENHPETVLPMIAQAHGMPPTPYYQPAPEAYALIDWDAIEPTRVDVIGEQIFPIDLYPELYPQAEVADENHVIATAAGEDREKLQESLARYRRTLRSIKICCCLLVVVTIATLMGIYISFWVRTDEYPYYELHTFSDWISNTTLEEFSRNLPNYTVQPIVAELENHMATHHPAKREEENLTEWYKREPFGDVDFEHSSIQWNAWWSVVSNYYYESYQQPSVEELTVRYALYILFLKTSGYTWYQSVDWLGFDASLCQWFSSSTSYEASCREHGFRELSLHSNNLFGTLPKEVGLLTVLTSLSLPGNMGLMGTLPTTMRHLTGLQTLDVYQNSLNGTIDESLWQAWRGIVYLNLGGGNEFTGMLPTQVGLLSQATHLLVGQNKLTGTIPSELGLLARAKVIDLSDNR